MAWIRWECGTPDSDVIGWLADKLNIELAQALGHYTATCCRIGEHRETGSLADVSDALLEQWALWRGPRGAYAAAFRERCLDGAGTVRGWWRQEAMVGKREKDRERQQRKRDAAKESPEGRADVARTTHGWSPGHPNANGRTDERTNVVAAAGAPEELAARFDVPAHRDAYLGFRRAAQNPKALDYQLLALADGMPGHGPGYGWFLLGKALHELAVAGGPCTANRLRVFLGNLVKRPAEDGPPVEMVTDDNGVEQPATRNPDGSWHYLTSEERLARFGKTA